MPFAAIYALRMIPFDGRFLLTGRNPVSTLIANNTGSANCASGVRSAQAARNDGRQKILGQVAHSLPHGQSEFALVAIAEYGGMVPADFVGRAAVAEIVECKRLARHSLETLQRIR